MKSNSYIYQFKIFYASLIIITTSCIKKPTLVTAVASVSITKINDSLPCFVKLEYYDITNGQINQQVTENTSISHNLHTDQYVIFSATALSNVSHLNISVTSSGSTNTDACSGNNCKATLRKNMYD